MENQTRITIILFGMWIGGLVQVKLLLAPLIWFGLLILVGVLWLFVSYRDRDQSQTGFGYSNMIELLLGIVLSGMIFGFVMGGL